MITRRHLLGSAAAATALTSLPLRAHAQDRLKIGFVHVGPVNDQGWTYRHDLGRADVEAAFGDRVETVTVENVGPGAEAERVLQGLVDEGCGLIFDSGSDHGDALLRVARSHPEVMFEHVGGTRRLPNVSTYFGRFYEGRYIHGMVAGHMSRTGIAGFVGSFAIPEVFRAINAFTLGMRSVNPEAEMRIIWINTWYDPAREGEAARTLIAQGADVINQHTDSPAPIQEAERAGVYAYGLSNDMSEFGQAAHLNAILKNWGPYYIQRTQAVLDGSWQSIDFWGGLDTNVCQLTPWNDAVPADVVAEADALSQAIQDGGRLPFAGPILRQDGTPLIGAGDQLSDQQLHEMDYYVQGVIGRAP